MNRPGSIASSSLACVVAWIALAAGPAAAVPGDPFDMRSACREDFERFCRDLGTEAARADIERCLASHEAELSPACRIAVGEEPGGEDQHGPTPARPRPSHPTPPPLP